MLFLYRHLGRLHTIEYHIIPMPPDAPKDQVDGHPHISTMHRGAGACSPPADPLSVSSGLPIQLAPSLKSPHPHLVWLPHNLAEGVRSPTLGHKRGMPPGAGGHKPTTLQPVGSPTIVPWDQPNKELAPVWSPSFASEEAIIRWLRRVQTIIRPSPHQNILSVGVEMDVASRCHKEKNSGMATSPISVRQSNNHCPESPSFTE
jgi:hypothetical protein